MSIRSDFAEVLENRYGANFGLAIYEGQLADKRTFVSQRLVPLSELSGLSQKDLAFGKDGNRYLVILHSLKLGHKMAQKGDSGWMSSKNTKSYGFGYCPDGNAIDFLQTAYDASIIHPW